VPKALDRLEGQLADTDSIVTTTSPGLQQLGWEALFGSLYVSAKIPLFAGNLEVGDAGFEPATPSL
jgi:hypothetical protein